MTKDNKEMTPRERCQDCVNLGEDENGRWVCGISEKGIEEIKECGEWMDEELALRSDLGEKENETPTEEEVNDMYRRHMRDEVKKKLTEALEMLEGKEVLMGREIIETANNVLQFKDVVPQDKWLYSMEEINELEYDVQTALEKGFNGWRYNPFDEERKTEQFNPNDDLFTITDTGNLVSVMENDEVLYYANTLKYDGMDDYLDMLEEKELMETMMEEIC